MKNKNNASEGTHSLKPRRRNDLILICSLLVLIAAAALAITLFRTDGDTVTVTVDGMPYGEYPLSEDTTVRIESELGNNVLVIRDGEAYVESADCPDGICSSHRPVSKAGESIICLPNKVVFEVHGRDKSQPDIVS